MAARRLGGCLIQQFQPPQAPARLFLLRLKHTQIKHSPEKPVTLSEIEQKKEELYDVLSNAEYLNFRNSRLMNNLSVQIMRRPWDPQWIGTRIGKRMIDVLEISGVTTLAMVLCGYWLNLSEKRPIKDGEEALGVKNKQDCKRVEDNDLFDGEAEMAHTD